MLLVTGCSAPAAPPAPSTVEGESSVAPGRPCAPATALPSVPPLPQDVALPAGAVVTAYEGTADVVSVTGRTDLRVDEVLDHFRTALQRAGFVLQRDEDEGRAGQLGFFGARADGSVTVARLTCPRGATGFTLRATSAGG